MVELFDMLVRGLGFTALVGSVAGPILFLVVLRPALSGREALLHAIGRRIAYTSMGSSLLLAAASIGAILVLTASVTGSVTGVRDRALIAQLVLDTAHGNILLLRMALAIATGFLFSRLGASPPNAPLWRVTTGVALLTLVTFPLSGHAAALPEGEVLAVIVDSLHLLGVTTWIGGLFHLRLLLGPLSTSPLTIVAAVRRFSPYALGSAGLIMLTGAFNGLQYVGSLTALFGTSYGLTLLTKLILLVPLLTFAAVNFLIIRPALLRTNPPKPLVQRLTTMVEGEVGMGLVILLLVGALTALPYAVEQTRPGDFGRILSLFNPGLPHFSTPTPTEIWQQEQELARLGTPIRTREAIIYSEFNHQWAGIFVFLMGLLCFLHAFRHPRLAWAGAWPLTLIGLSIFLFFRNDPGVWPAGPISLWQTVTFSDALQHRFYVILIAALGIVEWLGRTGRIRRDWWTYIFPGICIVASLMLFLHVHGEEGLGRADSLVHIQHVVMGTLGLLAGVSRWLELRLIGQDRLFGKLWGFFVILLGAYLAFFYREW
jgi:putative copper resistance protein D